MPYIKPQNRPLFDAETKELAEKAECAGDLNYIVTSIIHHYLKKKGMNYANINETMGALECCKLELYRAIAAPYENLKVEENGPVGIIKEFGVEPNKDIPGQQKIY
jgi:hypothetical protein